MTEASRAELRVGELVIDFGTPDQDKYTRGGWATGWSPGRIEGDTTFAEIQSPSARLNVRLLARPRRLVMRARSRNRAQPVTLTWRGRTLGVLSFDTQWSIASLRLREVPAGRADLEIGREDGSPPLQVDWISLPTALGATPSAPPARLRALSFGGHIRRALAASHSESYSFYVEVPAGGWLVFDFGSTSRAVTFYVGLESEQGRRYRLLRGRAKANEWTEHALDLSAFAGQAVRLELAVSGPPAVSGWGEPGLYVAKQARTPARTAMIGKRRPRNVILVVLDTTRADSFAPFVAKSAVKTPFLDVFATHGISFVSAYNNENWTKPSVATLLSGLYPTTHTARWSRSALPDDIVLLPQHLKKHGFATAAWIANAVVSRKFGFDRGWDEFHNLADSEEADASRLYRHASAWLDAHHERPFFLYVQSVEPHTPYEVPRKYSRPYFAQKYRGKFGSGFERREQSAVDRYRVRVDDKDLEWIWALYRGEVTFQDQQLGILLAAIDRLGLWDDTAVIITNDHGEEIRDHRHMGHGWTLYEEMIRAPLAMRLPPPFPRRARVTEVVEHVDLAPTIIDLLGLPPLPHAEGISFLPLVVGSSDRQPPLYAIASSRNGMRSIRVGRWKLIVGDDDGWLELFDVQADPHELQDRRDDAVVAGRLCEILLAEALAVANKADRLSASAARRQFDRNDIELDSETKRQLEALGYL